MPNSRDDDGVRRPRFGMRRMMLAVTLACMLMASPAWVFFGPAIAVISFLLLMQLLLLLLVRNHLSKVGR